LRTAGHEVLGFDKHPGHDPTDPVQAVDALDSVTTLAALSGAEAMVQFANHPTYLDRPSRSSSTGTAS